MDERDRLRRPHRGARLPTHRTPRPAVGGPRMSSGLVTPVRVESTGGLGSWFQHVGATIAGWPAAYRRSFQQRPVRTIVVTALVAFVVLYPLIYPAVPAN